MTLNEEAKKRLQLLSGINNNLNESKEIPNSILEYKVKANNGCVYGILREQKDFVIKYTKNTNKPIEKLNESDFVYINGITKKQKYSHASLGEANKVLNLMVKHINENFTSNDKVLNENFIPKDTIFPESEEALSEEEKVEDDKSEPKVEDKPKEKPKPEAKPKIKPEPKEEEEPSVDIDIDIEDEPTEGEPETIDLDIEDDTETSMEDGGDEDLDLETESILSLSGKLAQKLRADMDMHPSTLKNIVSTFVSSIPFDKLSDEDLNMYARKFKNPKKRVNETKKSFLKEKGYKRLSEMPNELKVEYFKLKESLLKEVDFEEDEILDLELTDDTQQEDFDSGEMSPEPIVNTVETDSGKTDINIDTQGKTIEIKL